MSQVSQAGIPFGAAGWRGVIGDDFTFGLVRAGAAAIARAVRAKRKTPKLLVAHDTRFLSPEFARAAAGVLESEGVHALLADRATPAPAVSFEIVRRKLGGGIYISAGQDPAEYNGLRFFDADGAPAGRQRTGEIERLAAELAAGEWDSGEAERSEFETPELETIDPSPAYLEKLSELVRWDGIRRAGIAVAYDAMHGAGAGWLDRLLVAADVRVHILSEDRDVLFDGRAPDPEPANLDRLAEVVRKNGAALGLASGGDGRRFGILDGQGRFVPQGDILGLIYDYRIESRGWGLGAASGVPEGDGILACLLVVEMAGGRGGLDGQLKKLPRRAGAEF